MKCSFGEITHNVNINNKNKLRQLLLLIKQSTNKEQPTYFIYFTENAMHGRTVKRFEKLLNLNPIIKFQKGAIKSNEVGYLY